MAMNQGYLVVPSEDKTHSSGLILSEHDIGIGGIQNICGHCGQI